MIKMEIRATTIVFAKRKTKQKRNEEKDLLQQFSDLKNNYDPILRIPPKLKWDRVKNKF